jgi:hypothetical protein
MSNTAFGSGVRYSLDGSGGGQARSRKVSPQDRRVGLRYGRQSQSVASARNTTSPFRLRHRCIAGPKERFACIKVVSGKRLPEPVIELTHLLVVLRHDNPQVDVGATVHPITGYSVEASAIRHELLRRDEHSRFVIETRTVLRSG